MAQEETGIVGKVKVKPASKYSSSADEYCSHMKLDVIVVLGTMYYAREIRNDPANTTQSRWQAW